MQEAATGAAAAAAVVCCCIVTAFLFLFLVQLGSSWLHRVDDYFAKDYVDLGCHFEGVHPRDEVRYDWSTPTNRSVDSTRMQTMANGTLRIRNPSKNSAIRFIIDVSFFLPHNKWCLTTNVVDLKETSKMDIKNLYCPCHIFMVKRL